MGNLIQLVQYDIDLVPGNLKLTHADHHIFRPRPSAGDAVYLFNF
ncbi:hypothetical protein D1BOALGB6SA_4944 [Olavius sp. associated proteobacterium Delta 1]|nr:hypothetical protein D1BOALGB6SA_4944 [Olavius sp. associated proteobacterium Delta 1]